MGILDPNLLLSILDQQRPADVLGLLKEDFQPTLAIYKAEALLLLDRLHEAHDFLDPFVEQLSGDDFSRAERLWSDILLRMGYIDSAILSAQNAAQHGQNASLQAEAFAWCAIGYARKQCWALAGSALDQAKRLAFNNLLVMQAEAQVALEMDRRLEARTIYERMESVEGPQAQVCSLEGRGYVAWLMGDFDQAKRLAESALQVSDQIVMPLLILGKLALASEDDDLLEQLVKELERRSPLAETLGPWRRELSRLRMRKSSRSSNSGQRWGRLKTFPTTIQKRNYCGPCTVELVLRYWNGEHDWTHDQIAQLVKLPGGGSPIYRMREFFHLVGFDTLRCVAPIDRLKQLIDAGYPIIIQQEFPDTSHVAVVIGYDDGADIIELQDPMTHVITPVAAEELIRSRRTFCDSAVVAFPRGLGHDRTMARLRIFEEPALVWADQAVLALNEGRFQAAATLAEKAVQRQPVFEFAWILWLTAELDQWHSVRSSLPPAIPDGSLAEKLIRPAVTDPQQARQRFYEVLERARQAHPDRKFVHYFEGCGALEDVNLSAALAAFTKASERDAEDSNHLCALGSCYFSNRQVELAIEVIKRSLLLNPALPAANAWMARCLAAKGSPQAEHYARCAVELAPQWWLAHLSLFEVLFLQGDQPAARQELEAGLSIAPNQPELLVARARIAAVQGEVVQATLLLESVLQQQAALDPATSYRAYQMLCQILFDARLFVEADQQACQMLELFPGDPWALQILAAARSEELLLKKRALNEERLAEISQLYLQAVEANQGERGVVAAYVEYLARLGNNELALSTMERVRTLYPEDGGLVFLHGLVLARLGRLKSAAQLMVEALCRSDAIGSSDELLQAVEVIVHGVGSEQAEKVVLQIPPMADCVPLEDRKRALGLVLATQSDDPRAYEQAAKLLASVVAAQPGDALATLRLGDVMLRPEDRQALYQRALLLAPHWPLARERLASFLINANRPEEALKFTDGHENDSPELLLAHGRALLSAGRYEEAVITFEQAVQIDQLVSSEIFHLKWLAETNCGRHAQALLTAETAHKRYPAESEWYIRRITTLRNLELLEEADELVEEGLANGMREEDFPMDWG